MSEAIQPSCRLGLLFLRQLPKHSDSAATTPPPFDLRLPYPTPSVSYAFRVLRLPCPTPSVSYAFRILYIYTSISIIPVHLNVYTSSHLSILHRAHISKFSFHQNYQSASRNTLVGNTNHLYFVIHTPGRLPPSLPPRCHNLKLNPKCAIKLSSNGSVTARKTPNTSSATTSTSALPLTEG